MSTTLVNLKHLFLQMSLYYDNFELQTLLYRAPEVCVIVLNISGILIELFFLSEKIGKYKSIYLLTVGLIWCSIWT